MMTVAYLVAVGLIAAGCTLILTGFIVWWLG